MKNKFFYKNKLTNIYERSSIRSPISSQILYGERFKILSKNKGWLKIKTSFDNYIGYIRDKDYSDEHSPTHKVFSLKVTIFDKHKKKTKYYLPFASKFSIIQEDKRFVEFEKNKWILKKNYLSSKLSLSFIIQRNTREGITINDVIIKKIAQSL